MYREIVPDSRMQDIEIEGACCPRCGAKVRRENGYGLVVYVCENCGYYFEQYCNAWY